MNMTEASKDLRRQRKTRRPRYFVRFDLDRLRKYGPFSTVSLQSRLCTADDIRRLGEAAEAAVA
jgi:hypothetical protein